MELIQGAHITPQARIVLNQDNYSSTALQLGRVGPRDRSSHVPFGTVRGRCTGRGRFSSFQCRKMAGKWEYEIGPLTANFRVLMEPKGFLRIVMVVSTSKK